MCWFVCVLCSFDLANCHPLICSLTDSFQTSPTYSRLGVRCEPNIWRVRASNEGLSHVQEEETRTKQGTCGCKSNEKTGKDFLMAKGIETFFHKLEIALKKSTV